MPVVSFFKPRSPFHETRDEQRSAPLTTLLFVSSTILFIVMHHPRASAIFGIVLIVATSVTATSPFPRVHPRGLIASTHHQPAEKRVKGLHLEPRTLTTSTRTGADERVSVDHASNIQERDADADRSTFALHSPKSLFARRMQAKKSFRRVAKRHDLTDGYGSLPELTDPTAVVDWALNGYGANGKTLANGYGSLPASLGAIGLGGISNKRDNDGRSKDVTIGARDTSLTPASRGLSSYDSSLTSLSGSNVDPTSVGPVLDVSSAVPGLDVVSSSPSDSSIPDSLPTTPQSKFAPSAQSKSNTAAKIHKPNAANLDSSEPHDAQSGADKACQVQVSYFPPVPRSFADHSRFTGATMLRSNPHPR